MLLSELTWQDVDRLDRDTPVIVPVAALEQHGPHMPVFTDSLLLDAIIEQAHPAFTDNSLVLPLTWLGNSHHHLDFPGTVSAEPRLWIDMLSGLVDNFIAHGFKRIVVINGHGGNEVPGRQAMFEIRQRYRERNDLLLLFATYWNLIETPPSLAAELEQDEMGHACEWETSMVLYLRPELVRQFQEITSVPPGNAFKPAQRAWIMPDRSQAGHIGFPANASARKGKELLVLFSQGFTDLIQRVIRWDGQSWDG
ncbi:MAG: creatininase family protein [Pirellulaceae bacterium]|nr:creatininase family protein [Pirellulaceae bacterium]